MRQLSITDMIPVRQPCGRMCECEWGSLRCLEKNGRMFDRKACKFLRDENGDLLIGFRECEVMA